MNHFKNKFNNLPIRKKFFLTMLINTLLITFTLLISVNTIFYRQFVDMQRDTSEMQLDYISRLLENSFSTVDNYSLSIISDEKVQDYFLEYKETYDYYQAGEILKVAETVNHIIQSTYYIYAVEFYDSNKEKLFSTVTSLTENTLSQYDQITEPKWFPVQKKDKDDPYSTISVFSYIRPFYSYNSGELLGFLEISVPESAISAIYETYAGAHNKIYIVNDHGYIESSSDKTKLGEFYPPSELLNLPVYFSYITYGKNIIFQHSFPTLPWHIIIETRTTAYYGTAFIIVFVCILIGLMCLFLSTVIARKMSNNITSPLHKLIEHTKTIKKGNWAPLEDREPIHDQDIGLLFNSFNSMINAQEHLKNDLIESQKAKDKIALDLLQEQINPHFLYNTLDNICSLAELNETETLINIVMNLSTFYRESLNSGKNFVTIKDEIELTKAYLEILKIRYHNKFEYSFDCPISLYKYSCLKLLLQPIVENSVYHGIKEKDGDGIIQISLKEHAAGIDIVIKDNGVGITKEKIEDIWNSDSSHFGIKNIHQRIILYYGNSYGLNIGNSPDGGCQVIMHIGKVI